MTDKRICNECGWHGREQELLRAANPFIRPGEPAEELIGCPGCRQPNTIGVACDEFDCWELATRGSSVESGMKDGVDGSNYRVTCRRHRPV